MLAFSIRILESEFTLVGRLLVTLVVTLPITGLGPFADWSRLLMVPANAVDRTGRNILPVSDLIILSKRGFSERWSATPRPDEARLVKTPVELVPSFSISYLCCADI